MLGPLDTYQHPDRRLVVAIYDTELREGKEVLVATRQDCASAQARGLVRDQDGACMPKLTVELNEELMQRLRAASERLWSGHGVRAMARLTRDAIRRYLRY